MSILIVLAILVFLIVVHEFGHFITAKLFGVHVEEFGVGYPPRAFLLGKWGGTEYTINWILAGGFVKLFGDEGDAKRHGRGSYVDAPRYAQAAILFAGVTMNAVAAWALFTGAYMFGVARMVDMPATDGSSQLVVADVVPGSPAAAANMAAGDRILAVTDTGSTTPKSLAPEDVALFVATRNGKPVELTYVHSKATTTSIIYPANAVIPHEASRPAIGLQLALVSAQPLTFGEASKAAVSSTLDAFQRVAQSLWTLVTQAAAGKPNIAGVVGPVGLVSVIGDAAHTGVGTVLAFAAFISVNLSIINLIPIPILDGGRILLLAIEAVLRREAPRLLVQILNTVGIGLILVLMLAVTYQDIARLLM